MSTLLVCFEISAALPVGGQLPKSVLVTVQAALQAKATHGYSKVVGFVPGAAWAEEAAEELAHYGLDEVVFAAKAELEPYLALTYEPVLRALAEEVGAAAVLGLASSRGKDLFPRLAFKLQAGQASDVTAFLDNRHYRRLMFAGNIVADVMLTTVVQVITVRATAFDPAAKVAHACPVRAYQGSVTVDARQQFVSFDFVKSERPELGDADIVVSGGRALKSAENFEKVIFPLAEVLGAAVGASRAAVDSGYAPNDWQVGQTGKVVAPKLYISVGISGAIQHLAGMKDSKVIVAINKDPDAPIFQVADYALVADLFQAVPELTAALKS